MKLLYPRTTGCLCANSHPGSYSGQDAYNDMLCVLEMDSSIRERRGSRRFELYA